MIIDRRTDYINLLVEITFSWIDPQIEVGGQELQLLNK